MALLARAILSSMALLTARGEQRAAVRGVWCLERSVARRAPSECSHGVVARAHLASIPSAHYGTLTLTLLTTAHSSTMSCESRLLCVSGNRPG
eukprot:scaffold36851_cov56-Phaeocystis_antarctica.AAC.2